MSEEYKNLVDNYAVKMKEFNSLKKEIDKIKTQFPEIFKSTNEDYFMGNEYILHRTDYTSSRISNKKLEQKLGDLTPYKNITHCVKYTTSEIISE